MFAPAGAKKWTDAGYAFVVQDVRGKGHSTGFYDAFANDIEDGYDSVEAIAKQPWSNGKVGITGASAMGITSNLAAIAQPPHLKAAYVIVAPNETFRTSFLGGVPEDKDLAGWLQAARASRRRGDRSDRAGQRGSTCSVFADRAGPGDGDQVHLDPNVERRRLVRHLQHRQRSRTSSAAAAAMAPRARAGNQRLTMGPFGHGELSGDLAYPGSGPAGRRRWARPNSNDIRWFDHWLKGADNGVMERAPGGLPSSWPRPRRARLFAQEPLASTSADWPPAYRRDALFPRAEGSHALHRHAQVIGGGEDQLPGSIPKNPVETYRRRQPHLRARTRWTSALGQGQRQRLPALPDAGARPRRHRSRGL